MHSGAGVTVLSRPGAYAVPKRRAPDLPEPHGKGLGTADGGTGSTLNLEIPDPLSGA